MMVHTTFTCDNCHEPLDEDARNKGYVSVLGGKVCFDLCAACKNALTVANLEDRPRTP